jgi:cytochrome c oxidase cbb3-type subunit 3
MALPWRWVAAALAGLAAATSAGHVVAQAQLRARLVRTDPDAVPRDPALTEFAIALAKPAYQAHCAACHGAELRGGRLTGAPDLTDAEWLYGDGRVADIEQTILYGIRAGNGRTRNFADMPAFARAVPYQRYAIAPLQPGEIRDVAEFLVVAAHRPGDRAAAVRGAKIFAGKGQCFDCHQEDARGDNAIGAPDLLDDVWLHGNGSRTDIADTISRGLSDFCPAWSRRLSAVTIRALAVFVHVASHPSRAHGGRGGAG